MIAETFPNMLAYIRAGRLENNIKVILLLQVKINMQLKLQFTRGFYSYKDIPCILTCSVPLNLDLKDQSFTLEGTDTFSDNVLKA